MTLIASTTNFSYPILIGDILMSSENKTKDTPIPSFQAGVNGILPSEQKFFPFSLRQKIYVIRDNLVIGFAGFEYEIKLFLEDIKNHFKYYPSNKENIEIFFDEYDYSNFKESIFLALYSEKKGNQSVIYEKYKGSWNITKSSRFENVIANGSGASYFIKHTNKGMISCNSNGEHSLFSAIAANYNNLCSLLTVERLSLDTLKEFWGAGFEVIYFNGQKFEKIDSISFIIWKGKVDLETEEYQYIPFFAMNYKYVDDLLVIVSTDFNTPIQGYGVLPIDKRKEDYEESRLNIEPNFKSSRICSTFILEFSNGKTLNPSFYEEVQNGSGKMYVDFDSNGHLEVFIEDDFGNQLIAEIKSLIKEHKISGNE